MLPRKLVPTFSEKFRELAEDKESIEHKTSISNEQLINQRNVSEIIGKYQAYKGAKLTKQRSDLERQCLEQISSLLTSTDSLTKSDKLSDIEKALSQANSLFEWKPFAEQASPAKLKDIQDTFNTIRLLLENAFTKLTNFLGSISSKEPKDLNNCICVLGGYLKFNFLNDSTKTSLLFQELGFEDEKRMKSLLDTIQKKIERESKALDNGKESFDAHEILGALNEYCRITKVVNDVKDLFIQYSTAHELALLMDKFVKRNLEREMQELWTTMKAPVCSPLVSAETKKLNEGRRDEYFARVNRSAQLLEKFRILDSHYDFFGNHSFSLIIKELKTSTHNLYSGLTISVPRIADSFAQANSFNVELNILLSIKRNILPQYIEDFFIDVESLIEKVKGYVDVNKYPYSSVKKLDDVLRSLEKLKIFSEIDVLRLKATKEMESFFRIFKGNAGNIFALENALTKSKDLWCQDITQEFAIFKGAKNALLMQKIKPYDPQTLENDLVAMNAKNNITRTTAKNLMSRYEKFNTCFNNTIREEFDRLFDLGKSKDSKKETMFSEFPDLQNRIKAKLNVDIFAGSRANKQRYKSETIIWPSSVKEKLHELIADLFALWSLKNSAQTYYEVYFDENSTSKDMNAYILRPHATQVLSIFRLLGVDSPSLHLEHHLVQIGTGEGKSVTLAIIAMVLALYGMDVICACYSDYLSRRDYECFENLFTCLGLSSRITYGTFQELIESIITRFGDTRNQTERFFFPGKDLASIPRDSNRPKVFLIDEEDVFFSEQFYGITYTPSVPLKHEAFTKLVYFIWENKDKLTTERLLKEKVFEDCVALFPHWRKLLAEAATDMLYASTTCENHKNNTATKYKVDELTGQIKYIEQSGGRYSADITYGYPTMFAYFYEYEQQQSKQKLIATHKENSIAVTLRCGNFSYAEAPRYFGAILGVSGTLPDSTHPQYKIITQEYGIKNFTVTPSVFSKGAEVFDFGEEADVHILPKKDHYKNILKDCDSKFDIKKRPVIIFFESDDKLMDFFHSEDFSTHRNGELKEKCQILDESVGFLERPKKIANTTLPGALTLSTRAMGRGTDFRVSDEVSANGGLHVIQAFLSLDKFEETQIKGRTARMSCKGNS